MKNLHENYSQISKACLKKPYSRTKTCKKQAENAVLGASQGFVNGQPLEISKLAKFYHRVTVSVILFILALLCLWSYYW